MSSPPQVYAFSHKGHRTENQDRFKVLDGWSKDESLLAIVADGMGGHEGGSLAAKTAISTAEKLWPTRHLYPSPKAFLSDLANLAQNAVIAAGKRSGSDPRSTLVALYIKGDQAVSMHIGDSRVIQYNKQKFLKRTRDHSLPELHFQRGKITEAQISTHPDQNKLTKSLGQEGAAEPDFEHWDMPRHNNFVVCSDGFWGLWHQNKMGELAQQTESTVQLQKHIEAALENKSGHDNVTAIIIHTAGSGLSLTAPDLGDLSQWRGPLLAFVGFGVLVLVGIFFLLQPLFVEPPRTPQKNQQSTATVRRPALTPDQLFPQTPANSGNRAPLPDFETAMSETEKMLENLDQASWEAATREKQKQKAEESKPKRPATTKPIWEPVNAPYINARAAAKTVAQHLREIGILGTNDSLMAKSIDTASPLDPTPVRVEFSHFFNKILVLNSSVWVDIDNRQMIQIGGRPAQNIDVDKKPKLSFEAAAKKAEALGIEHLAAGTQEKLVIFRSKTSDHLGWMLEGRRRGNTETLIISAKDGTELFSQPTVSSSPTALF